MKPGDLIRYRADLPFPHSKMVNLKQIYLVRWVEEESDWVCVFGIEPPFQMSAMEVISAAR